MYGPTPNERGTCMMRAFLAVAHGSIYVGNAHSAAFWNWKARDRLFKHQSGFILSDITLDGVMGEHNERMANIWCERLANFELHNRADDRNVMNNSHLLLFTASANVETLPETSPDPSPLNLGVISPEEASPDTSPDSSLAPVPVVLPISVSGHFQGIMTIIDTTHDALVLTPTNDGGVMDLQRLLDTKISALRAKMNQCQSQVQNIKNANETRIDELLDKIPSVGCMLSRTLMRDAVQAADGRTYDRSSIEQWFAKCRSNQTPLTSPWTRAVISEILVPNKFAQDMIDETLKHWGIH